MATLSLLRSLRAAALAAPLLAAGPVLAQDASPWAQGLHSRVRLVAGGIEAGRHLAGVEIALDPGYKTYWRDPGESGLPPRFDWGGSAHAGAIELKWPAPQRIDDAGGAAHVYLDRIILPVLVTPDRPGARVRLELAVDYGVCKEICIPARAEVSLALDGSDGERGRIGQALAAVPEPQSLGHPGPLSILSVEPIQGGKPRLAVTVRRPAGTSPSLFAEAPDNWFFAVPARGEETAPDESRFVLKVEARPRDAPASIPLRLTVVAAGRAVESEAWASVPPKP